MWAAATTGLALLAACHQTLDAGYDLPRLLPVGPANPVIIYQDDWSGDWLGEYAVLLANSGGPPLVGIVINATTMPNMIEQAVLSTCPTYMNAEAPIKCGNSTTGITSASGLPSAQAASITVGIDRLYSYST